MIVLRGLLFIGFSVLLPLLFGEAWNTATGRPFSNTVSALAFRFVTGTATMWALFQIVFVPFVRVDARFRTAVVTYGVLLGILAVVSIVFAIRQRGKHSRQKAGPSFLTDLTGIVPSAPKAERIFPILLLCGIAALAVFQIIHYLVIYHADADDARFLVTALEAVEHDQMFRINPATGEAFARITPDEAKDMSSPWMIFVAFLSLVTSIHPTILAHGALTVLLLVTTWFVYLLVGDVLFGGDVEKRNLFLFFAIFLLLFFGQQLQVGRFVLTRIWQGKAVLASVGIPLVLCLFFLLMKEREFYVRRYVLLIVTCASLCLLSVMGVIFSALLAGCGGFYLLCYYRKKSDLLLWIAVMIPPAVFGLLYYFLR